MLSYDFVTQPNGKSNRDLISYVLQGGDIDRVDIAAAYVTTGGARDLLLTLRESLLDRWPVVQKRWLISFDYCRTEPLAVRMLMEAPRSSVRVHDVVRVLKQQCIPTSPFHPKTFIFGGKTRRAVFAGSGNISRSGLNTGHEVGLLLDSQSPVMKGERAARSKIAAIETWFQKSWEKEPQLNEAIIGKYREIFDSVPNLSHPIPTDDDPPERNAGRDHLAAQDLRKLRACSHFWIEAGNITKNLGRLRPGNQLMMKRLSRVFFGVPAVDVPQNSPLRTLKISYGQWEKSDCSLTFSDNGMDKLTLPVPESDGPPAYDGMTLLFTRIGPGIFKLECGTERQKREWMSRSKDLAANFEMSAGGRKWGVF